jgi:hypothetical protein
MSEGREGWEALRQRTEVGGQRSEGLKAGKLRVNLHNSKVNNFEAMKKCVNMALI